MNANDLRFVNLKYLFGHFSPYHPKDKDMSENNEYILQHQDKDTHHIDKT